ncbi:MAG: TetR family transcriptional regulator [Planctomycetota bacterium]
MGKLTLRQRNRLEAMRRLQVVALNLFEERGFDDVTMQDVAQTGGVSESTLYRYFGTKEALILWDEFDPDAEIVRRFHFQPPAAAFRDALIVTFTTQADLGLFLRRVQFIFRTAPIHAAAIEQQFEERDELAQAFAEVRGSKIRGLEDDVLAGACMTALDGAFNHWQLSDGQENLATLIEKAFAICFPGLPPVAIGD